ncbi:hypothetical protein CH296_27955 [Rhodococcus sp. 14-2496-1d]|uniref:hypothetical protein n=1 Tax=Rhodococcus sp. 14-2496-1d TaxID=2023146 RepID=UPI000B9AA8A8|nr:hypothetical protein [Rhodococcus sp. 14-2496-1d]OZF25198.1 hypothetical protein CH296_27955 [Rhodococcus sp. 14-2496-1d]
MTRPATHVYRSTTQELVAALLAAEKRRDNFKAECDDWADTYPMDSLDRGYQIRYNGHTGDRWFAGFEYVEGDDTRYVRKSAEAPHPGWKFNRRIGCWVADPRTEAGKALARSMPYVKGAASIAEQITGFPTMIIVGTTRDGAGIACAAAEITVADRTATAVCAGDPFERSKTGPSDDFLSYWTPMKLSDYYAEQGL